jgi:hypothetical protein
MKVAKLVYVSMVTRVIVDEDATDEQIIQAARPQFAEKVQTELGENLEEIVNDEECPYDPAIELTPEELKILKNRN